MINILRVLCAVVFVNMPKLTAQIDRTKSMSDAEIDRFYGAAESDRGAQSQHEALAELRKNIAACGTKSPSDAIPYLGRALVKISSLNIFQVSQRISTYDQAQVTLLSIPGHADYFAKEIQISRAKAIDRQAREGGEIRWEDYDDVRSAAIHTLENLPSPEAVRVLGELLSDSEKTGPQISEGHLPDAFGPPPNASLAADALKLLIEKPPVPQDRNWQKKGDIEAWQLWYEQIQSGNRTFRFKGDPKDYDLTGPASNDKLQRVERNLKRDDERTAGQKKSSTPVGTQTIAASAGRTYAIAGLVITLALVAAALWYFLRSRIPE